MSKMKRVRVLLLCALLLCSTVLMCACGNGTEENSNEATYSVTVKDVLGNPYSGEVIVKFMQNGEQAAMQVVNENGVAEKTLPKGDYTVELMYTNSDASYYNDSSDMTLTADKTALEIQLAYAVGEDTKQLFAGGKEYTAYYVNVGSTYVSLESSDRNFFLFTPTVAGTYEFSTVGGSTQIGYYGAPHFVQSNSIEEAADNTFTVSVSASMINTDGSGTTVIVIGIDATDGSTANCYLNIERIGEPKHTLADEPWTIYQPTVELSAYTLPEGTVLKDFDLTAASDAYNLVLNEEDGFYHLDSADGPLVYARLAKDSEYLDSFKTILDCTGVNKYFFDSEGNFIKKESYTDCLLEYLKYVDEDAGVYPLTEDLMYIFQNHGGYAGWWDPEDARYRFVDANGDHLPGINNEIAWLFLCYYAG